MSPVYNPPREKMSRLTLTNLAILGVNVLVAIALVVGLWKSGRFFGSSGTPAGASSADGTEAAPDPSAARGGHSDAKTEPGTAVYYSSSAEYEAAHPASARGASTPVSGSAPVDERRGSRGSAPGVPGTATYSIANPSPAAGSTPGGSSAGPAASSSGSAAVPSGTSPGGSSATTGTAARSGLNPPNPSRDGFTTTGRTSPPTSAPPPIHTPTTPGSSSPPTSPSPGTHHDEPPPTDDPPPVETEPGSDRTPPVLDSLAFDPTQVADGGSTILYVHAHDDLSGVRSVTGTIKSPTGGALFSFNAVDDGSGTNFAARINVPPKAESGAWYVANLYIADRVDNTLVLGYTPANAPGSSRLNVVSSQSDTAAPTLIAIDLENPSVRGGETEHVRLTVTDDISGVAAIVGAFQSPARTAGMNFTARALGDDGNTWAADLAIPGNADCGEWRMTSLRMTDRAGNAASLGAEAPQLARVSFGVMTDLCDSSAPYLESLTMAPTVVSNEAASVVTLTAIARDDGSGVSQASGWVGGPVSAGGETPKLSFTCGKSTPSDPDSPWTCRIPVPQFAARGTWHMGRFRLQDRAGNVHDYMPDENVMESATFDVQ